MTLTKRAFISLISTLILNFAVQGARGGNFVTLKVDTPVAVKVVGDVDTSALKEGDKVLMAVAEEVKGGESILVEVGAPVKATFMPPKASGEGAGFLYVSNVKAVDGQRARVRAAPDLPTTVGAVDGAARIPIPALEGNGRIPEGTTFTVYISENLLVEE